MRAEDVRVELGYNCLKVYFLDTLHLRIKLSELIGVQSWRTGDKNFSIEYTMIGGSVTTEYDCPEKWKAILSGVDRLL